MRTVLIFFYLDILLSLAVMWKPRHVLATFSEIKVPNLRTCYFILFFHSSLPVVRVVGEKTLFWQSSSIARVPGISFGFRPKLNFTTNDIVIRFISANRKIAKQMIRTYANSICTDSYCLSNSALIIP